MKDTACNNRLKSTAAINTLEQHPSAATQPIQNKTPCPTYPKQTRKSPLLPTPLAPVSSHKKHNLPTPPFRDSQHHCKQHIPGPHCTTGSKQWPPLLPNPTISGPQCATSSKQWPPLLPTTFYHHTILTYYEAYTIGPYQPQIPVYVPVIMSTLTDKFMNLLYTQHNQNTNHQKQWVHKGTQTDIITLLWRIVAILNILEPSTIMFYNTFGHFKTTMTTQIGTLYFYHCRTLHCNLQNICTIVYFNHSKTLYLFISVLHPLTCTTTLFIPLLNCQSHFVYHCILVLTLFTCYYYIKFNHFRTIVYIYCLCT